MKIYSINKVNYLSDNTRDIPGGHYCYSRILRPGNLTTNRQYCRHYRTKEIKGIKVPYCSLLDKCGITNTDDDDKLYQILGPYEWNKLLTLDLLWDAVKECGIR